MSAQSVSMVRRAIEEAVNKGNLAVIDEVVDPTYVYREPTVGEMKGPEGLKQLVTSYRNAFPDLRLTIEDQIDGGNKVVTRWTGKGIHRGELFGTAPTGKEVTVTGIIITRVENGKIVEESESYWSSFRCDGVRLNIRAVHRRREVLAEEVEGLRKAVIAQAGKEFDLDSPTETASALCGINAFGAQPRRRVTLTQLEQLAGTHYLPRPIVKYRRVQKLVRQLETICAAV
jgi:predicted ester cyclase